MLSGQSTSVRVALMEVLAQGDRALERTLLRADLEDPKHHDEVLRYDERLSRLICPYQKCYPALIPIKSSDIREDEIEAVLTRRSEYNNVTLVEKR
jgi:hypothetical protein